MSWERSGPEYFQRILRPVSDNPPQVVYMVSYLKDGVALVRQIRAAGITSLLCGGAGGFTHPDFIKQAGESGQHFLTATLWTADQQDLLAKMYAAHYLTEFGQVPDYHGAEAYSAAMVVADALRRTRSFKAVDMRKALGQTDLATPFGRITFLSYEGYERQNRRATLVLQALGDRYQCVWPQAAAKAGVVLPPK